ncbi:hypothetical protein HK098_004846 [Nowakowskiella sp. JEL0407]|nr:hypothetical protein HK098_004846 [Nowakowskiella sp. JEL0407]
MSSTPPQALYEDSKMISQDFLNSNVGFPTDPNYKFPKNFLKTRMRDSGKIPLVLVACGSFSPITYLHLRMFEMARDFINDGSKYEIMGGYFSPVSDAYGKSGLAKSKDRVKMCELAVEDSNWLMVDSWEASSVIYVPTVRVINHFNEEINGTDELGLLMDDGNRRYIQIMFLAGGDLIESFSKPNVWSVNDLIMILGKYGCVVVERTGTDVAEVLLTDDRLFTYRKNVLVVKQFIYNDISSTKIRLFVKRNMSVKYLMPDAVIKYIIDNELYKSPSGVSSLAIRESNASGVTSEQSEAKKSSETTFMRLKEVFFNVLFLVVHGNSNSILLEYVSIFVEDVQLLTFFWTPFLAEGKYEVPAIVSNVVEIKYREMKVEDFLPYYAVSFSVVTVLILNLSYILWGYLTSTPNTVYGKHVFIWSMKLLRFMASILPTVFFVPILEIFLITLQCDGKESYELDKTLSIESYKCSEFPHELFFYLSIVLMGLFIPLSVILNTVFFDMNPTCKTPMNRVNGRVSLCYVLLKILHSPSPRLDAEFEDCSFYCSGHHNDVFNDFLSVKKPYFNPRINQLRSGIYFGCTTVGIIACIAMTIDICLPSIEVGYAPFIAMASLFLPGCFLGAWLTDHIMKRTEFRCRKLEAELQASETNNNIRDTFVFTYPHQVELTARFIAKNMGGRRRNFLSEDLPELKRIFKRGIQEFPENTMIRISFAAYIFYLTKEKMDTMRILSKTASMNASLDDSFLITTLTRVANQSVQAAELGFEENLDISSFAEYLKLVESAHENFSRAIGVNLEFWKLMHSKRYKTGDMWEELEEICLLHYKYSNKADLDFALLISRFPYSKLLLRSYARFCFEILNDVNKGQSLLDQADMVEDTTLKRKRESEARKNGESVTEPPKSQTDFQEIKYDKQFLMPVSPGGSTGGSFNEIKDMTPFRSHNSIPMSDTKNHQAIEGIRNVLVRRNQNHFKFLYNLVCGIFILTLGIIVGNFVIIGTILKSSQTVLTYLRGMHFREFQTDLTFKRLRDMQESYTAGNSTIFEIIRNNILVDERETRKQNDYLYQERTPKLREFYSSSWIPLNISLYPDPEKVTQYCTFYKANEAFVNSGIIAANVPFEDWKNITMNNNFRYIADNYVHFSDCAFKKATKIFFQDVETNNDESIKLIAGLTVAHIVIVLICAGIIFYAIKHLRANLRESLRIFKSIRASDATEMMHRFETIMENDEEDELMSPQTIKLRSESLQKHWTAITVTQYATYCTVASLLSVLLATSIIGRFYNLGERLAILDQCGSMKIQNVRLYSAAREFVDFENNIATWNQEKENLISHFVSEFDKFNEIFNHILYGNYKIYPPSPSYDMYPPSIHNLFVNKTCITDNNSQCDSRIYNYTIGYTPDVLNYGLVRFTSVIIDIQKEFYLQLQLHRDKFIPDPSKLEFLKLTFDEFEGGYTNCEEALYLKTKSLLESYFSETENYFLGELATLLVGVFLILFRAIRQLQRLDRSIANMVVQLPHFIRKSAEVTDVIKTLSKGQTSFGLFSKLFLEKKDNIDLERTRSDLKLYIEDTSVPAGSTKNGTFKKTQFIVTSANTSKSSSLN